MASIQSKTGKHGKKTFYVVASALGKHRWIKAGTKHQATILKKQIEAMREDERLEKLGISSMELNIETFFAQFLEYTKLHTSANTYKRYRAVIDLFLAYLKLYQKQKRSLSQIKSETIEHYQAKRLSSIEIKKLAVGEKNGNHRTHHLPKPQTVNFELGVLRSAFLWAKKREYITIVPNSNDPHLT